MTQEEHDLLRECLKKLKHGHTQLDQIAAVLEAHTKSDSEMFFGSKDYIGIVTTLKVVKTRLFFLTFIAGTLLSAVLFGYLKPLFVVG